jgi:outer membrane protein assembly factor BamE (lipoprotein component of BamABCDE complex)
MPVNANKFIPPFKGIVLAGALAALAGCSAMYRDHGYVPSQEELAEVVVGVDTRDSVAETVGVPSSTGVLDNSGYYYIETRFRHYGAKAPEAVSREMVAITFAPSGTVTGVERYGLEDGRVVQLERRVTDTGLQDKTFLRQLLGNLGNFDPASALAGQ